MKRSITNIEGKYNKKKKLLKQMEKAIKTSKRTSNNKQKYKLQHKKGLLQHLKTPTATSGYLSMYTYCNNCVKVKLYKKTSTATFKNFSSRDPLGFQKPVRVYELFQNSKFNASNLVI